MRPTVFRPRPYVFEQAAFRMCVNANIEFKGTGQTPPAAIASNNMMLMGHA